MSLSLDVCFSNNKIKKKEDMCRAVLCGSKHMGLPAEDEREREREMILYSGRKKRRARQTKMKRV